MRKSIMLPSIRVDKYKTSDEVFTTYHLVLDGKYEGCYSSKAEVLERISQLVISEVSRL